MLGFTIDLEKRCRLTEDVTFYVGTLKGDEKEFRNLFEGLQYSDGDIQNICNLNFESFSDIELASLREILEKWNEEKSTRDIKLLKIRSGLRLDLGEEEMLCLAEFFEKGRASQFEDYLYDVLEKGMPEATGNLNYIYELLFLYFQKVLTKKKLEEEKNTTKSSGVVDWFVKRILKLLESSEVNEEEEEYIREGQAEIVKMLRILHKFNGVDKSTKYLANKVNVPQQTGQN